MLLNPERRILDSGFQLTNRFNDVMIHAGAAAFLTNYFLRSAPAAVTE